LIVPDSSVWINHFRGAISPQVTWLRSFALDTGVVVGDVVALEVLRGASNDRQAATFRAGFEQHGIMPMLNPALAVEGASHYRRLRSRGITVSKTVDLIIATFCIAHGYELLHQDRDFDHFEQHLGLKVLHPA